MLVEIGFLLNFEKISIVFKIFSDVFIFISMALVGQTLTHIPQALHLNLLKVIFSELMLIAL